MADISAIKALDGITYSIKDSEARDHLVPASGTTGQVLTKTASGYGWADASGGGTVDTVNGISPDSNKNVQVDVELTQAQYDALPASKLTDDVNYFIKDGAYRPQGGVIDAEGVMYDNTESGLTSDTVQGAIDENASAIEELSAGLSDLLNGEPVTITPSSGYTVTRNYSKKIGNNLFLCASILKSSGSISANSWTSVGRIDGYALGTNIILPVAASGSNATARGEVNASGGISMIFTASSDGGTIVGLLPME